MFYPFEVDYVQNWAYYTEVFSPEECSKIIEIGLKQPLEIAEVTTPQEATPNYRKSKISWITPTHENNWIYKRLTDVIKHINEHYFKFDLYGLGDAIQFTEYSAPDGVYNKHVDKSLNQNCRKLSITVQLSDPTTYEGGDLEVYLSDAPQILLNSLGTANFFPSYVMHKVTPVTKGKRFTVVTWLVGPYFK